MPKVIKIYGPPGTGKTTTLISMLKNVLESGVQPIRVAYITHTVAACEEAKTRVVDDLGLAKNQMKWFRTIHSTCCGMAGITRNESLSRQDYRDFERDTGYTLKGAVGDDVESSEVETYDIVIMADQIAKGSGVPLREVTSQIKFSPKLTNPELFLEAYHQWKKDHGKLDFTDMLLEYANGDYPAGPVDVVFVDEAQDLSKLQWSIVNKLSADADTLYLAGDDDQAIYKFLGADEFGFLDYPSDEDVVLDYSFRVPKEIGEVADKIIQQVGRRKEKEVTWKAPKAGEYRGDITVYQKDPFYLPWKDWAASGEEVMVLTRHVRQGREVSRQLSAQHIPHTLKGKCLATEPMGINIGTYLYMTRLAGKFRPAVVARMLKAIGDSTQAKRIQDMGVSDRKIMIGQRDITFPETDDWPKLFSSDRYVLRDIQSLRDQVNEYGIEIIGKKPLIDVSTYHGSKGREADTVVLYTDCYRQTDEDQRKKPDDERRVAYVGLTRARKNAIIISPQTNMYIRALVHI